MHANRQTDRQLKKLNVLHPPPLWIHRYCRGITGLQPINYQLPATTPPPNPTGQLAAVHIAKRLGTIKWGLMGWRRAGLHVHMVGRKGSIKIKTLARGGPKLKNGKRGALRATTPNIIGLMGLNGD